MKQNASSKHRIECRKRKIVCLKQIWSKQKRRGTLKAMEASGENFI
jgi:hypothetical protein